MKIALLIILLSSLICIEVQSQTLKETLDWLNENTKVTVRDGSLQYSKDFFFDEEGFHWGWTGNGSYIIRWSTIEAFAITEANRVYVAYGSGLYDYEYITPADGVIPEYVETYLRQATVLSGNQNFRIFYHTIPDADMEYKRNQLAEYQELSAFVEAGENFLSIFGTSWEMSGAIFEPLNIDESISADYKAVEKYTFADLRWRFVYGKKRIRLRLDPLSFSWIYLPSYSKYDANGLLYDRYDFGQTRFYSPGIGISYVFFPKKDLNNFYREWEIPVSVHYSFLLLPYSSDFKVNNVIYDSEFVDYFSSNSSRIQATIGLNLFPGETFGIGANIGLNYLNVMASSDILTETINDDQIKFTYEFDDINKFAPFGEIYLIFRMYP